MSQSSIHDKLHRIEEDYKSLLAQSTLDARKIAILRDEYRKSIEQTSFYDRASYFFGKQINQLRPRRDALVCIVVIKDEPNITLLLDKLAALSFDQIILIDDHSSQVYTPSLVSSEAVNKIEVKAGTFGLSKVLWIESICNYFFDGSWVATIDADEFIDIDSFYQLAPPTIFDLAKSGLDLKGFLRNHKYSFVPFCLLDVLPSDLGQAAEQLFGSSFYYYFSSDQSKLRDYGNLPAVKWSFGSKYDSQYFTDLRYHFYQIAESRSKISLMLWDKSKNLMLHQGFHNVTDRSTGVVHDMAWVRRFRVPCKTIVHQKVLFTCVNPPTSGKLSQYFPRTAQNISALTKELFTGQSPQASGPESLFVFRGTLFMPSWTQNGKLLYTTEELLDSDANALNQDYEFVRIPDSTYDKLLLSLHCFVAQKVVRINRRCRYIQLRNIRM